MGPLRVNWPNQYKRWSEKFHPDIADLQENLGTYITRSSKRRKRNRGDCRNRTKGPHVDHSSLHSASGQIDLAVHCEDVLEELNLFQQGDQAPPTVESYQPPTAVSSLRNDMHISLEEVSKSQRERPAEATRLPHRNIARKLRLL